MPRCHICIKSFGMLSQAVRGSRMCAAGSLMASENTAAAQKLPNGAHELPKTTVKLADPQWQSLGTPRSELTLDFTLPTGQSFRWRKSGEQEYTGVVHNRLVSYTPPPRGPPTPPPFPPGPPSSPPPSHTPTAVRLSCVYLTPPPLPPFQALTLGFPHRESEDHVNPGVVQAIALCIRKMHRECTHKYCLEGMSRT